MAALSPRARRAVTLIFLAVIVIAATAAYYVRSWVPSPKPSAAATVVRPFPVQKARDVVSYTFVSLALGWAAEGPQPQGTDPSGTFAIFRTVDAGRHWQRQLSGRTSIALVTMFTLKFVDPHRGFVLAGDPLALYRTGDGGEHWTRRGLPNQDAVGLQATDSQHLWLYAIRAREPNGMRHYFASSDSGDTWTQLPDRPGDSYFYPLFRDASEGWSGASDPTDPYVIVTADGGLTWQRRDLPREPEMPQPVATAVQLLPGAGVLVLVYSPSGGLSPAVHNFTSMDGGRSWRNVTKATVLGDLGTYTLLDARHWWSIQGGSLYKTDNGGQTWTAVGVVPAGLSIFQLLDARHAWAQLDEGFGVELAFTSDGGLHWDRTNPPIAQ